MAGIDAPYRDPREELRTAVFGQKAAQAAAQPVTPVERIPVGDATEVQQPRLKPTPAQAPGGSPEFQQARANIGAVPAAQPAAPVAAAQPAPTRMAGTIGTVARGAIPTAAGVALGMVQNKIDQGVQVDPRVTARTGPGEIPFDASQAGPAPVAERSPLGIGPNNEVTRNIANALNAVPGGGVAVQGIGRISRALSSGLSTAQQVVRGAQSVQGGAAAPATTSAAASPRNGGPLPAPPEFNDRRFDATSGTTPAETGVVRYDPLTKTYSGTDVKEGASITGGINGGRGTGRGTVTVLPTGEGYAADLAQLDALGAERADREAGFAVNQPGGGVSGISGSTVGQDLRAKTDRVTPKDILQGTGRGGSRAAAAAAQAQAADLQAETAARTAEVTARGQDIQRAIQQQAQAGQQRTAELQANTQRDIARINADARQPAAAQQPRYTPVALPDEVGPDGFTVRRQGQALLNNQTGEIIYPGQQQAARPAPPQQGAVVQRGGVSYRFKGGDPSKPESWEKV